MTRVLFVCHGNICRSPMAEFIFKEMVKKAGRQEMFEIASAATSDEEIWNGIGNPVYPPAKEELALHGIKCDGKRARRLVKADYEKYDYLIGMDSRNMANMARICGGDPDGKMIRLLDLTDKRRDVADPWYTRDFAQTYDDIVCGLEAFMEYLDL